jgi:Ca2+-transporting ATPase
MPADARRDGPRRAAPAWHTLAHAAVLDRLSSHSTLGLSGDEARARLGDHGRNVLETQRARHWTVMLASQLTDFMIVVLLAAAVVAGAMGEPENAVAIGVIVVLNALIGFVQEFRAERAMSALKRMASRNARVIRDGLPLLVPSEELVPGDLVLLEAGDVVPADVRLIETASLLAEEAALTGESSPVQKGSGALAEHEAPLGERTGMAYKGTVITHGRGRGVVVATGMRTELGHIASLLSPDESKTPLQRRLGEFGRRLALAVLGVCVIVFVAGWLRGEPPITMFLTAVSLAVAGIPEALPAVVTISLALGASRMVRQHALMRRLPAVETLGSVTYVCTDKTGTLTANRMRVATLHAAGETRSEPPPEPEPGWRELMLAMALCNDARFGAGGEPVGEATEAALLAALPEQAVRAWAERYPRVAELPFEASRARMTTLHRDGERVLVLCKGAPESVLPRCTAELAGGRPSAPGPGLGVTAERLAAEGQRVLAFAVKTLPAVPASLDPEIVERELGFVGFVGLMDPPRAGVEQAVAACQTAGIAPVMITGDHAATAKAIAVQLGIAEPGSEVLTGRQLARLPDERLDAEVRRVRVYARTTPEQKIRIVEALQRAGELVAMTGDGVNDAPALTRADIGVAMGKTGTDVAREAADLVLLDDNFATIVAAVREGRRIYDNIRKFVRFVMGGNTGEILTLFLAPFLGLPVPLLPIQILWVNLVTDGLPGLALAAEPGELELMRRPPRPPNESVFARGLWQRIVWVGLLIGGLSIFTQAWAIRAGLAHWQSMVFTVLTWSQMFNVLAIRSERESLFRIGVWTNRPLLLAVLSTVGLQLAVLYSSALQPIFKTEALTLRELGFCVAVSSVVFFAVEAEKLMTRLGWLYRRT